MANQVFVVVTRNDLPDGMLQYTDVTPNTSQRNPSMSTAGQTGYISVGGLRNLDVFGTANAFAHNLDFDLPTMVGGAITNANFADGLAAFLLDHIETQALGLTLTPAQAHSAAERIILQAVAGNALTQAAVCAQIDAVGAMDGEAPGLVAAAGGLAGADPLGNASACQGKTSADALEDMLRVLAGDLYRLENGAQIHDNVGAGVFGTVNHPAEDGAGNVIGGFVTAPNSNSSAAATFPQSLDFRDRRTVHLSGAARAAANGGQWSVVKRTQSTTLGDSLGFRYEAALLPSGTAAVYGSGTAATARGMTRVDTLPAGTAANPSVFAVAGHAFQDGDVVRVTNIIGTTSGTTLVADGTFTVANTVDNVSFTLGGMGVVDGTTGAGVVLAGALISRETGVTSNHRDIETKAGNLTTHHQFRGCMVYDSQGNVL